MSTNEEFRDGTALEPQEWVSDPSTRSAEAVENEPDDILAAMVGEDMDMPLEASEADVLDQRADSGLADEGDAEDLG